MTAPIDLASGMLGKGEVPDRATIQQYLRTGGVNMDPATAAWCAAFVNSTLQQAGMKGTGSNMARSFLQFGMPVKEPQRGDIAVFTRGDPNGPYGHVGFFDGVGPDGKIRVLGGNQGNKVSITSYDPSRLLGYRRAGDGAAPVSTPPIAAGLPGMFGGRKPDEGLDPLAMLATGVPRSSGIDPQQEAEAKAKERARREALFGGEDLAGMFR